ncbi:hypothetical protein VTN02DRAFT_4392 [Thermoascus thermophilus]
MMEYLSLVARRRLLTRHLCPSCLRQYFPGADGRTAPRLPPFSRRHALSTTSRLAAAPPGDKPGRKDEDSVEDPDPPQAYPLSGYYADILSAHTPDQSRAPSYRPVAQHQPDSQEQDHPTPASTTEPQSPEDKMSIVFGSRLAGPGYRSTRYNPTTMPPESTWKNVNGVSIPPRPVEPDNCCMSGCVHCVWDDYRDDLEEWAERVEEAHARATPAGAEKDLRQSHREEVESASTSMDDDGGGSETNWSVPSAADEELFAGIPVGIREFMKTEKKLREKHREEKEAA